jgi:hypothetical protein
MISSNSGTVPKSMARIASRRQAHAGGAIVAARHEEDTLIPAGSPLFLLGATGTINSRGQIAGFAFDTATGEVHAYVATPSPGEAGSEGPTPATGGQTSERPKVVIPENVRKLLQQRLRLGAIWSPP